MVSEGLKAKYKSHNTRSLKITMSLMAAKMTRLSPENMRILTLLIHRGVHLNIKDQAEFLIAVGSKISWRSTI